MATKTLMQFESELLPRFLARRHWFPGGAPVPAKARIAEHAVLAAQGHEWLLALIDTPDSTTRAKARWFVPLALAWEGDDGDRLHHLAPMAVAKVRMQAQVGVMADALADVAFCRALVQAIGAGTTLVGTGGRLRFVPTQRFSALVRGEGARPVAGALQVPVLEHGAPHALAPSHNTTAQVGEHLFLKLLRRVQPGVNAEVEMACFLQDVAAFDHAAPLAGRVEWVASDGHTSTLALLHAWVHNQGSAWTLAVEHLARELERADPEGAAAVAGAEAGTRTGMAAGMLSGARLLGQRTAELHATLARHRGDQAFDPEPWTPADLQAGLEQVRVAAATAQALLDGSQAVAASGPRSETLSIAGAVVERLAAQLQAAPATGQKTRIHGAYRLQEILLVNNDFVIVDFEGPASPAGGARRSKESAWRDVASMLHSFDLARLAALQAGAAAAGTQQTRREGLASEWLDGVRAAFLEAYAKEGLAAGLWPDAAAQQAQALLGDLFELEMTLQELADALRLPGANPATALAALDTLLTRHGAA